MKFPKRSDVSKKMKFPKRSDVSKKIKCPKRSDVSKKIKCECINMKQNWRFFLCSIVWQLFHSIATNFVYYLSSQKMTASQRLQLYDVGFALLPELPNELFFLSDIIVYSCIGFLCTTMFLSIFFQDIIVCNSLFIVIKRYVVTVSVLQFLRIISFCSTLLPGPAQQCRYTIAQEMNDNYDIKTFVSEIPANEIGNSIDWNPPKSWEIIYRIDASKGCGDLMFSSHTTFSVIALMTIYKYFTPFWCRFVITLLYTIMIFLTLLLRKHYTIDVFTASYIGPIVFELLYIKFPDKKNKI